MRGDGREKAVGSATIPLVPKAWLIRKGLSKDASSDRLLSVADVCRLDGALGPPPKPLLATVVGPTTVGAATELGRKADPFTTSGRVSLAVLAPDCRKGADGRGTELVPTENARECPRGDGEREVLRMRRSRIVCGSWSVDSRRRAWLLA